MGEIKFADGSVYTGEFKDGKRSGQGRMIYEMIRTEHGSLDSGTYEGEWKRGNRHGKGTMSWSDSSKFDGEWRAD